MNLCDSAEENEGNMYVIWAFTGCRVSWGVVGVVVGNVESSVPSAEAACCGARNQHLDGSRPTGSQHQVRALSAQVVSYL